MSWVLVGCLARGVSIGFDPFNFIQEACSMAKGETESFVDVLVTDPANVPAMVVLSGFLGKSSLEGYQRLYLNIALSEYYEIPSSSILHSMKHPLTSSPLGETTLWAKQDVELIRNGVSCVETRARFFEGPIQQCYTTQTQQADGAQNCSQVQNYTAWAGCQK
jgi:hypothetical protein